VGSSLPYLCSPYAYVHSFTDCLDSTGDDFLNPVDTVRGELIQGTSPQLPLSPTLAQLIHRSSSKHPQPHLQGPRSLGPTLVDTLEQIDVTVNIIEAYSDTFALCRTSDDVEVAIKQGKIASLLGLEGYVDSSLVGGTGWKLNWTEHTCLGTPLVVSGSLGRLIFCGASQTGHVGRQCRAVLIYIKRNAVLTSRSSQDVPPARRAVHDAHPLVQQRLCRFGRYLLPGRREVGWSVVRIPPLLVTAWFAHMLDLSARSSSRR
jgi:hypothetical protein